MKRGKKNSESTSQNKDSMSLSETPKNTEGGQDITEGSDSKNDSGAERSDSDSTLNEEDEFCEYCEYDLVGVTVHTGTADGGHYYSFIKERSDPHLQQERWFLFNDAEVKLFDPPQLQLSALVER